MQSRQYSELLVNTLDTQTLLSGHIKTELFEASSSHCPYEHSFLLAHGVDEAERSLFLDQWDGWDPLEMKTSGVLQLEMEERGGCPCGKPHIKTLTQEPEAGTTTAKRNA
ncbi:hypothetical protein AA313_de0208039 [Arthrobotrys entomopaga]|nr:hypothetical protein AA313_de0208039 [Arthrobotrys entomopaga]